MYALWSDPRSLTIDCHRSSESSVVVTAPGVHDGRPMPPYVDAAHAEFPAPAGLDLLLVDRVGLDARAAAVIPQAPLVVLGQTGAAAGPKRPVDLLQVGWSGALLSALPWATVRSVVVIPALRAPTDTQR